MDFPKITIGIVNSREDYINECLNSVNRVVYPGMSELYDVKIFNNYFNKHILTKKINLRSIGSAFNAIAQKSIGDWILFVGDDDMISRMLPFNYAMYLITYAEKHPEDFKDVVCVTGNMILFDSMGKREHLQSCPTGMWRKEYILNNKFDETLTKYVDTEMFARAINFNKKLLYAATDYGYYYRQHNNNVSGNKFSEKSKLLKEIMIRNERQHEIGGING